MSYAPPTRRALAALTISGSDSGGGTGIQGDLRTFAAHDLMGCCAVTAVTAQNTVRIERAAPLDPEFVTAQLEAVLGDLPVRAIKIGMLATPGNVEAVAKALQGVPALPVVLDPTLLSGGTGAPLLTPEGVAAYQEHLLPLATVVAVNPPEAETLLGQDSLGPARDAAAKLRALTGGQAAVVIQGGHRVSSPRSADLVLLPDDQEFWLDVPRIETRCTLGTGDAFTAAITAHLARGESVSKALRLAKRYVTGALVNARPMGAGFAPVDHLWPLLRPDEDEDSD